MEKALRKIASIKVANFDYQGFVLMVVLLFSSILSLFMVASLKINLLVSKSKDFYLDKIRSFYLAEMELVHLEDEVLSNAYIIEQKNIKMIERNFCGDLYRVRAMAKYRYSASILESTVLKLNIDQNCKIDSFRQSFLVIQ